MQIIIHDLADLTEEEAKSIIGQKVVKIHSVEYGLELTFENGKKLKVFGSTYGDCALSVEVFF